MLCTVFGGFIEDIGRIILDDAQGGVYDTAKKLDLHNWYGAFAG